MRRAAIAEVAGVEQKDVAEALRAGSRLERIGMVENLISDHNITDLADLMKVSSSCRRCCCGNTGTNPS